MHPLVPFLWVAGGIQLFDAVANFAVPRRIQCSNNLARVSPVVRQIFLIHWFYILFVLVVFGLVCIFFATELAGGSPLGRFISGALAVFWFLRVIIQVFYFDSRFKKQNRMADAAFTLSSAFLCAVFAVVALGIAR